LLVWTGTATFNGSPGILTGQVILNGDSLIQFASGQISTIAAGSSLVLNGSEAFIADAGHTDSNSALTGLSQIKGSLDLGGGASISTSGGLDNVGNIWLDDESHNILAGTGNTTLSVNGLLTNSGSIVVNPYPHLAAQEDIITTTNVDNIRGKISLYDGDWTTGGFDNESGVLTLVGNSVGGNAAANSTMSAAQFINSAGTLELSGSAELNVTSGAASLGPSLGELVGTVSLSGDALLQFAYGGISTIAAKASLAIYGEDAFVADAGATTTNSALTTLSDIGGEIYLAQGASITSAETVTNTGTLVLDTGAGPTAANTYLVAAGLINSGTIEDVNESGGSAADAFFYDKGAFTNNGAVDLFSDTQEFVHSVSGTGTFDLNSGSTLLFDSWVGSGQTITDSGADSIVLRQAGWFGGKIAGFAAGDTIDAQYFADAQTAFSYHENAAGTAGVLTLTEGSQTANLDFVGNYKLSDFGFAPDSGGKGTLISFV
jgi:hypothetical protein